MDGSQMTPDLSVAWHRDRYRHVRFFLSEAVTGAHRARVLHKLGSAIHLDDVTALKELVDTVAKDEQLRVVSFVTEPDHSDPYGNLVTVGLIAAEPSE